MMPDGNMNPHKGMKSSESGNYMAECYLNLFERELIV